MRIRDLLIGAVAELQQAGCETPRLDAEVLLADALGVGRAQLVLDRDEPVPAHAASAFAAMIARRRAHEPVAYIVGRREFRYITLRCDRRALIPGLRLSCSSRSRSSWRPGPACSTSGPAPAPWHWR